jgi:hypothetical protein
VRPEYGRFRAFLLVSAKNFLHNERDRERAVKRGGGRRLLSLDAAAAERTYEQSVADRTTPEDLFERAWARTLFHRVVDQLQEEASRRGRGTRVARLWPFLTDAEVAPPYLEIAEEWNVGESAVRAAVHRLRKDFGTRLRDEVRRTVADDADLDDEVRYILAVLAESS